MTPAAGIVNEVSPVWVLVVLQTHFDRLLQMVIKRQYDGRLFYRVNSDGRLLDSHEVDRILDGAYLSSTACFNNDVGTAQLVREAAMYREPDSFYRSPSNVARPVV